MSVGAIILRREPGFWCIDTFDHNGRWQGSDSGNHSFPAITGWRSQIDWAPKMMPLAMIEAKRFLRPDPPRPRVGLMRFGRPASTTGGSAATEEVTLDV